MNALEKMNALLSKPGRTVVYGPFTGEEADPLVTLHTGESVTTLGHLGDVKAVSYPVVAVSAVSADYMTAYNLGEQIKAEIKQAQKATLKIVHRMDAESYYDKETKKHIVKSLYKIILI